MIFYFICCILFGIAVGFGLRFFEGIGQIIFWLIVLYQAGWDGLIIAVIISAYREAKKNNTPFKIPYGGLTEYAVLSTYSTSGLIGGYWFSLPWSRRDTAIMGIILTLIIGATIVFVKGELGRLAEIEQ